MTVRTLSGATVTLVGRGANYFDGDVIIPSFVDAAGTQYFIINDPDDLTEVPGIVDGLFTVNAAAVPPFTIAATNAILVNDPTTNENSTSALVFAKRCGIEVSLAGLHLVDTNFGDYFTLVNQPLTCVDGGLALWTDSGPIYAEVEEGWGADVSGFIGCDFQPVSEVPSDFFVQYAEYPLQEGSESVFDRRSAHNAWLFILAGVPESVFATV